MLSEEGGRAAFGIFCIGAILAFLGAATGAIPLVVIGVGLAGGGFIHLVTH